MSINFKPEKYHKPQTTHDVSTLLQENGAKIIAGGTDLFVNRPPETRSLVDLTLLGLDYVKRDDEGIAIGATTCFTKIIESPILDGQPYSVLKESAKEIGHHNLRHIASIGGNICNAVPSADSPVALIALDANSIIDGVSGERTLPLKDFFKHVRQTVLKPGEYLKEVQIPQQPKNSAASFQKIGRTKVDIALVNACCRLTLEDGAISDSRMVLGAVAPTPVRVLDAETYLNGKTLDEKTIEKAAQLAASATSPISDHRASAEYRLEMSRVLAKRAILGAYEKLEAMK